MLEASHYCQSRFNGDEMTVSKRIIPDILYQAIQKNGSNPDRQQPNTDGIVKIPQ